MTLLNDLFPKTIKKVATDLLDDRAQKIVNKGTDMSNQDLYNLCLINKERDEIDNKEE